MKIFTNNQLIRKEIRNLLRDSTDSRIIVSAFVGKDALSFLPNPNGIQIYCWPKAGGTNPYGIEDLIGAKVKVHFVDRLHSKIFWSKKYGVIIGSANLTLNALGDGGLSEVIVKLPPDTFDMPTYLKTLSVEKDFQQVLEKLKIDHSNFYNNHPYIGGEKITSEEYSAKYFGEWVKANGLKPNWQFGWYEENSSPPPDTTRQYKAETGFKSYADYLGTNKKQDLIKSVPTICFLVKESGSSIKISKMYWWKPFYKYITKDTEWKDDPFIWYSKDVYPKSDRKPFPLSEEKFKSAFKIAVQKTGGLNNLKKSRLQPSKEFLNLLHQYYK